MGRKNGTGSLHGVIMCCATMVALMMAIMPVDAKRPAACVIKAGSASGPTRGFAEYESELIIRQVTGNWPVQSDRIGKAIYRCKQDAGGWTCVARAEVCKT